MSDLIVTRDDEVEHLSVTTPLGAKGINRAMTVAELTEALSHFPPGMLVTRYCDECVTTVTLEHFGSDESEWAHGKYPDQLPSYDTAHVALS